MALTRDMMMTVAVMRLRVARLLGAVIACSRGPLVVRVTLAVVVAIAVAVGVCGLSR